MVTLHPEVMVEVRNYEKVSRFTDPPGTTTWLAMLACGHERKLTAKPEPEVIRPDGGPILMVCYECTRLQGAEGA